jgi:hypothetical protein
LGGSSAACIDPGESVGPSCNTDADCATGKICFTSCAGQTCQTFQDCVNSSSAKMLFRRGAEARKAVGAEAVKSKSLFKRELVCTTEKFYCDVV